MRTKRTYVLSAWAVAVAAIAVMLVPGVASAAEAPFDTNTECLECHSVDLAGAAFSKVDFTEPPVDRAAACSRCHWQSTHPVHNPLTQCQTCHGGMPWRSDFFWADVATPYGYFTSAASASASATILHDVHVNGSWPQTVLERPYYGGPANCVSCHAPVACDACHPAATAHGTHSSTQSAPVSRRVTKGSGPSETRSDTTYVTTEQCATSGCHPTSGAALPAAALTDDAGAAYSGSWYTGSDYGYYAYTYHATAYAGSTATFIVAGSGELRVFGDNQLLGGMAAISIDGAPAAYFSVVGPNRVGAVLYRTQVGAGTHTVVITSQLNPATGYSSLNLDAVGVFAKTPVVSMAPTCASCHADRVSTHGYENADHVADIGAALDPSGTACGACHAMDLATEHDRASSSSSGTDCGTCHPTPRNSFTTWNDTCAQGGCHLVRHTAQAFAHDASSAGAGCGGVGCHNIADVGAIHAESVPGNTLHPSCVTCHTSPNTVPATLACAASGCHSSIVGHRTAHQTAASAECVACHEYANVQDQHAPAAIGSTVSGKANDGCNICHGGGGWTNVRTGSTRECVSCHNGVKVGTHAYSPADPNHYPTATHAANIPTCKNCHSADLKTEHFKPTVAVTCVACHEGRVDYATAPWDKACETALCHTTKHVGAALRHQSTRTECAGTGCHAVTAVDSIHTNAPAGCNTCHVSASQPATTTDCLTSGCHFGSTADHKESHNTTGVIDPGCKGCHFTYLTDEHTKLGYTCSTCHASANAAVKAAISGHDCDCSACHPAVNGRDRHASQNTTEFIAENSSGHRVNSTLPFAKSSFVVNGATYNWPLPAASSFLKTSWTTTSIVTCDKCHNFGTSASGPHGAAVTVTIDPAYPTKWKTVYLSDSGASSSTFICAKCHTNFSSMNKVHDTGDHHDSSDGKCVNCHAGIPHAWRMPRLIAYTTDPVPYRSATSGLSQMKLRAHSSPSDWSESDCYASCAGDHSSQVSPIWPSKTLTVGTLTGRVTAAVGGAGISGATVAIVGGASTTTDANGYYTFAGVGTGTYSVTVSKTGYLSQTASAIVASKQTTTLNFALALTPTTGTITGTVTDSATSGKLAGVAVSVSGGGSAVTDTNGVYTLTNVAVGTRSVTYAKSGYTTQTASVSVTAGNTTTKNVALAALPATNIARGKTAGASSVRSGYEAAKAVDGSTSTRWYSNGANTQWLQVDLGLAYSVEKVVIPWYSSYYAKSYKVQTSTDGSAWTDVYTTTSGSSGTKTHTFTARSARYVRIYCTSANSSTGYSITELEIWGK